MPITTRGQKGGDFSTHLCNCFTPPTHLEHRESCPCYFLSVGLPSIFLPFVCPGIVTIIALQHHDVDVLPGQTGSENITPNFFTKNICFCPCLPCDNFNAIPEHPETKCCGYYNDDDASSTCGETTFMFCRTWSMSVVLFMVFTACHPVAPIMGSLPAFVIRQEAVEQYVPEDDEEGNTNLKACFCSPFYIGQNLRELYARGVARRCSGSCFMGGNDHERDFPGETALSNVVVDETDAPPQPKQMGEEMEEKAQHPKAAS